MLLVRHCDEVEYLRPLNDRSQEGTVTKTLDLACCYFHRPFESYYLVQEAEKCELNLHLEVRQKTKDHGFFVGLHNVLFFCCTSCKAFAVLCTCVRALKQDKEFEVIVCAVSALFGVRTAVVCCLVMMIVIRSGFNKWFYGSLSS